MKAFSTLKSRHSGFTLAELLITVLLMGLVAVFTIPPLFQVPAGQKSASNTAVAREVTFMIASAYQNYKMQNSVVPTTLTAANLIPYMNYVSQTATTQTLDSHANDGGIASNCAGGTGSQGGNCYLLHSGGALWADTEANFGGSTTLNVIYFRFDPNAKYDGAVNDAPGMGMQIALYYDGVIRTRATLRPNSTYYSLSSAVTEVESSVGNEDPSWFTGF